MRIIVIIGSLGESLTKENGIGEGSIVQSSMIPSSMASNEIRLPYHFELFFSIHVYGMYIITCIHHSTRVIHREYITRKPAFI